MVKKDLGFSTRFSTQRLVITAVFTALALIAKLLQINIFIGGFEGMHISAAGVFSTIPAILFGPIYGAAVGGMVDGIGFLLNPTGAWIPWLTLTAIAGGAMKGILWRAIENINALKKSLTIIFSFITVCGIILIILNSSGGQAVEWLYTFFGKRALFVIFGVVISGVLGCLAVACLKEHTFRLVLTIGISGLIVTTLNTIILMRVLGIQLPFSVFYLPRLIEEIIMTAIQVGVATPILVVVKRIYKKDLSDGAKG